LPRLATAGRDFAEGRMSAFAAAQQLLSVLANKESMAMWKLTGRRKGVFQYRSSKLPTTGLLDKVSKPDPRSALFLSLA
jgi:hypothetical protein